MPRHGPSGSWQYGRNLPATDTAEQVTKESITALSLHYGVLSKYVSLVAVESRSASQLHENGTAITVNGTQPMKLREVPVQWGR